MIKTSKKNIIIDSLNYWFKYTSFSYNYEVNVNLEEFIWICIELVSYKLALEILIVKSDGKTYIFYKWSNLYSEAYSDFSLWYLSIYYLNEKKN